MRRRIEMLASAVFLLFFILAAGCGRKEEGTEGKSKSSGNASLMNLLPGDGEIAGLKHDKDPFHYAAENLWEIINGAAEEYIEYGVVEMVGVYTLDSTGNLDPQILIFDMGEPINAFGIFSQHRSPEDDPVAVGNEGISTETNLYFYAGRYYVQVTAQKIVPKERALLREIADLVAKKMGPVPPPPPLLRLLPAEAQVPRSLMYHPKEFLGYQFLKGALSGEFQGQSGTFKAFVIPFPSESEATRVLEKLQLAWKDLGFSPETWEGRGIALQDPRMGHTRVFQAGAFLGGIRGEGFPEDFPGILCKNLAGDFPR